MKLSARNQLKAKVAAVNLGEVMSPVRVTLPDGQEITAAITKASVQDLDVKAGDDVLVIIKSTEVPPRPGSRASRWRSTSNPRAAGSSWPSRASAPIATTSSAAPWSAELLGLAPSQPESSRGGTTVGRRRRSTWSHAVVRGGCGGADGRRRAPVL
jgi:molybdopterin-binding protein